MEKINFVFLDKELARELAKQIKEGKEQVSSFIIACEDEYSIRNKYKCQKNWRILLYGPPIPVFGQTVYKYYVAQDALYLLWKIDNKETYLK